MSQTESIVAHCTCGHGWELQKSPDDMSDGPRCSECGAVGNKISIDKPTAQDGSEINQTEDQLQESRLVQVAKRERRSREIRVRVDRLVELLKETAPSKAEQQVASELQGIYWELESLQETLPEESDSEIGAASLDNLEAVSDRLDELERDIENQDCELATIDDLNETIAELQSERDLLREEIESLEKQKTEIEGQIGKYTRLLDRVEDEETAWNIGYEVGRKDSNEEFAIHIPCARCRNPMLMRPGSDMHKQAAQYLRQQGWSCAGCT